ncbi:hypothetical protein HF206_02915 [Rhizobium leguminosarum]|uniref:hypothetical protein n=1 Tax=Rhizobium leguminosarum TaxID=384 RepID=UPI001C923796|nr:hypothetical protein [Rhizobium leguminosarum]MBY2923000.1 hypothetical protein [Rhizobium leguminosarum]MBY2931223.1 hypothetical protein [Rhizobium leguminosarum]MBY2968729.1 hypothetical protein [Rhizobium leguminosarum]MBY2976103.1 hypothetical protein [Rhizobium leguminosarum]
MIGRGELNNDEWKWLVRLCQHEADSIPSKIETRFVELGLSGSNGLSDDARSLVEHELLAERRNRLQGRH